MQDAFDAVPQDRHVEVHNQADAKIRQRQISVIGVAIEIHREFGPGLLEKAYVLPLVWALEKRGFAVEFERPLSIEYDGRVTCSDKPSVPSSISTLG